MRWSPPPCAWFPSTRAAKRASARTSAPSRAGSPWAPWSRPPSRARSSASPSCSWACPRWWSSACSARWPRSCPYRARRRCGCPRPSSSLLRAGWARPCSCCSGAASWSWACPTASSDPPSCRDRQRCRRCPSSWGSWAGSPPSARWGSWWGPCSWPSPLPCSVLPRRQGSRDGLRAPDPQPVVRRIATARLSAVNFASATWPEATGLSAQVANPQSGVSRTRSGPSVADAGAPVGEELHQLGSAHDGRAGHEIVLVELALLEARRADVHRSSRLDEILHELLEGSEALLVDALGPALRGQPDALHAQKHQRLLARAHRGIRDHEADGGLVRIVVGVRDADAELARHGSVLLAF